MSIKALSDQVASLSEAVRTTLQLISRLSKLTFAPGSTPLDGEGDVRVELSQDIHESLKQHEETFELLKQEVEELVSGLSRNPRRGSERDREKDRLAAQIARLGEEIKHARSQFRRAQLTAKRASEAAKQQEREILFAKLRQSDVSDAKAPSTDIFAGRRQQHTKQLTKEELAINASSDITAGLRRTHDLLAVSLSQSQFQRETLEQSTAALSDLGERYSGLDTLLSNSKKLLGTLVQSQKSDTWYLEKAFYLLIFTIGWLVFRRWIYGPAWWFIWLPIKYFLLRPFLFIYTALLGGKSGSTISNTTAPSIASPPLRVQPSAKGGPPRFMADQSPQARAVPVGGGGAGAKRGPDGGNDPSVDGSLSQKIGQMAEQDRQEAQDTVHDEEPHSHEPVKRADGTVLKERGDRPPNSKKRMWDENVEAAKHEARKRDEL